MYWKVCARAWGGLIDAKITDAGGGFNVVKNIVSHDFLFSVPDRNHSVAAPRPWLFYLYFFAPYRQPHRVTYIRMVCWPPRNRRRLCGGFFFLQYIEFLSFAHSFSAAQARPTRRHPSSLHYHTPTAFKTPLSKYDRYPPLFRTCSPFPYA